MGKKIKISFIILILSSFWIGLTIKNGPPEVGISNGLLDVRLYLPDPNIGIYRASRFDWSGVISSLKYEGHELQDDSGYGYLYTKTVKLVKGKPKMLLAYSLKNTGKKTINTTVYNHHFFMLDGEPTGPNIKFTFPYDLSINNKGEGSTRGFGTLANIEDGEIRFERKLNKGEHVYSSGLQGFGSGAEDHQFSLENIRTGAGVTVKGDKALEKLVFWANPTAYCAEPYIPLKLIPGETVYYQNEYTFYTIEMGKN